MSIQLTSASGYNASKNMVFDPVQMGGIPDSKFTYKRITINTRYPDGSVGPLIIPTEELFSFGVGENLNPETGKVNGYVFPLAMYSKDGVKPKEKEWVETFNSIVDNCKKHLIEHRKEIEMYELEESDLKKLNPMYYKKEKGVIVPGSSPTLYVKLIVQKKENKIMSMFYDRETGNQLNALDLIGKYMTANAAIKIESIFIGSKINLQVKLYEADVKLLQSGMPRLLSKSTRILHAPAASSLSMDMDMDDMDMADDKNEVGSIDADEEEDKPKEKKTTVVKKVVKKTVAKKA